MTEKKTRERERKKKKETRPTPLKISCFMKSTHTYSESLRASPACRVYFFPEPQRRTLTRKRPREKRIESRGRG